MRRAASLWLTLSLLVATMARADEPYRIPVITPLSGIGAFIGQPQQATLSILEKQVNASGGIAGRPVQFVFYDDESNPQTGVQLLAQILGGHPQVVLGSSLVAVCSAIAPMMRKGPFNYCLSPAYHPQPGSYVFGFSVSSSDTYAVVVRYFRLHGWTRFALIANTDASGQDGERGIVEAAQAPENAGVHLLVRTHFSATDVSVPAQVARRLRRRDRPDAIVVLASGTPTATVFKALIQAGLDVPVATPNSNVTYAQMEAYRDFL